MRRFCSAIWADVLGDVRLAGGFAADLAAGAAAAAPAARTSAASAQAARPATARFDRRGPAITSRSQQDVGAQREDRARHARRVVAEVRAGGGAVNVEDVQVQSPLA